MEKNDSVSPSSSNIHDSIGIILHGTASLTLHSHHRQNQDDTIHIQLEGHVNNGDDNNNETKNMESDESQGDTSQNRNQSGLIFVDKNQSWTLTWPIWHMLPRSERKTIALQNGYKTIGDFEEYMSLNRALIDNSNESSHHVPPNHSTLEMGTRNSSPSTFSSTIATSSLSHPYDNALLYELQSRPKFFGAPTVFTPNSTIHVEEENIVDSIQPFPSHESELRDEFDPVPTNSDTTTADDANKALRNGGQILTLPDDILLYRIFSYLDIDSYAVGALVSPHWKSFTRTEAVFKELCQRCYLQQSKRKVLNIANFGHSYRTMLFMRPRVKTGGGFYVLKYSQIKPIQRDMWTEIPVGAILETTYYRYLSFQENGRVLYALSPSPPYEMIPKFVKMKRTGILDPCAVWGSYEIQKYQVVILVSQPWHYVQLHLNILPNGSEGATGRFWALSFVKHLSSISSDFNEYWSRDLVEYVVPSQPFLFLRDWRL